VWPCIASIILNDYLQDANILAYSFILNQLYMFRVMLSPIIRSTSTEFTASDIVHCKVRYYNY